jgi:hypothetical protein
LSSGKQQADVIVPVKTAMGALAIVQIVRIEPPGGH